jgi:L-rhamnose mutarotase
VPALEGPWKYGTLCLWKYSFPLSDEEFADFQTKLQAIPKVLKQAKINLREDAKDLWFLGIRSKKKELSLLDDLAQRLDEFHPELVADVKQAKAAVKDFTAWLEEKQKNMTAPSGIGIENYNWYMKNVHLWPYTWEDQLVIMQRELDRSLACLKLEENRNRNLPQLKPVENTEEYQRRHNEAVDYFMDFLRRQEIMTVPDYLNDTLKRTVKVAPAGQLRDFFTQIEYRDSLPLRCHGTHWFDLARMKHEPHPSPIRSVPLLYNIWDSRAEGLATGMEEMMMHAGLMDNRPRVRELVYIMLACRVARGMGDLMMHSNEFSLEDAVDFAVKRTPRGWMPKEGNTVWFDEQLYLQQPGYGTSYVVCKVHLEKMIADYSELQGENFSLKQFMDEFHSKGMIPLSLIRWEMTGLDDEIKKLS